MSIVIVLKTENPCATLALIQRLLTPCVHRKRAILTTTAGPGTTTLDLEQLLPPMLDRSDGADLHHRPTVAACAMNTPAATPSMPP